MFGLSPVTFPQVALPLPRLHTVTFHVMRAIVLVMCTVHGNTWRPPRYPQPTVFIGGQHITSKQVALYCFENTYLLNLGKGVSCLNTFFSQLILHCLPVKSKEPPEPVLVVWFSVTIFLILLSFLFGSKLRTNTVLPNLTCSSLIQQTSVSKNLL